VTDVAGESARLYESLQKAVDDQMQQTGFVPPDGYGMNGEQRNGTRGSQQNGDAGISEKQLDLITGWSGITMPTSRRSRTWPSKCSVAASGIEPDAGQQLHRRNCSRSTLVAMATETATDGETTSVSPRTEPGAG